MTTFISVSNLSSIFSRCPPIGQNNNKNNVANLQADNKNIFTAVGAALLILSLLKLNWMKRFSFYVTIRKKHKILWKNYCKNNKCKKKLSLSNTDSSLWQQFCLEMKAIFIHIGTIQDILLHSGKSSSTLFLIYEGHFSFLLHIHALSEFMFPKYLQSTAINWTSFITLTIKKITIQI